MRAGLIIGTGVAVLTGIGVAMLGRKEDEIVLPSGAGVLRGSLSRKKRIETRAVVYHSTSRGLPQRLVRAGHTDPMDPGFIEAAVERYQTIGAEFYANALIAPDGSYEWLAHPDLWVAHAVTPHGKANPPGWWRERWPDVDAPLDLIDLTAREYINPKTVSIDVIPLPDADALRYTAQSLDTAARIGRELAARYGLSLERRHHLAHSDLDPWARGDARGGWDPGWDWADFMQRLNGGKAVV
jgi:hypothetical protein